MKEFIPWVEKYRPAKLSQVFGNDVIVRQLEAFVRNRNPPHLLFAGPAGSGKTSCALAMAHEIFGENLGQCFLELNASDERGIDVVRTKIKDFARTLSLASVPFKIIFLDEADALTADAQQALRRTMEKYSGTTRFILSCNYSSRIIEPIQSRCAVFRFSRLQEADLGKMLDVISVGEGLKIEPKAQEALLYVSEGDARKLINSLQGASAVSEKITAEEIYKIASRARPEEVEKMVHLALKGSFTDARKMLDEIMLKYGMSGEEVILQIFREVTKMEIGDKEKVLLVDRVGEYDFRMVEGANERIQLEALLAQIMLHGKKS
ncbi:MAG TPA: replication factor C small subunit [Candidatus Norongarragalinales archaeon]|nr:replication factor C small subunit [Candidatus Norongarragalinales archaeon]